VYSIDILLLAGIAILVAGAGIGALLARRLAPDTRRQRELERSLDQLLQQQKDYQQEVVEHFSDTARLLNKLAESYRDVHNHLASGAGNLCDDRTGTILGRLPDAPATETVAEPDLSAVQAPLDYAPKASPFETGVLNEEFGLEKRPAEVEQTEIFEEAAASPPSR